MPRRYNSSRKIYVPKKKWAPHFKLFGISSSSIITSIADNTASNANPTPVIVKVKNIKVDADINTIGEPSSNSTGTLFILYLPEGNAPTSFNALGTFVEQHPEYIMGWTTVKFAIGEGTSTSDSLHITTRLSRNLNSGDKVVIALWTNVQCQINGAVSFVTCAN